MHVSARPSSFQCPEVDLPGALLAAKATESIRRRVQQCGDFRDAFLRGIDHEIDVRAKAGASLTGKIASESANYGNAIKRGEILIKKTAQKYHLAGVIRPEIAI